MDGRSYKFSLITITISKTVMHRFRYTDQRGKERAIQQAIELLFEKYMGPDSDPWPYIKGV